MSKTRKKMEKKPWQEQQELKIILDASPIGFSWSDMQGNIKYINRRFQELFGYNVDDISNIDAWLLRAFPSPAYREQVTSLVVLVIEAQKQGKEASPAEVIVTCKDGSIRHVLQTIVITSNRILAIYYDITELKQAEEALRESEEFLRKEQKFSQLLFDTSSAFIVAIGYDGKTLVMNQSLLDALEYTKEEIKGTDYLTTFVPEEDRVRLFELFQKIVREGRSTVNENRIISRSGRIYLVEWHGRPASWEGMDGNFFVGVGIDITARKQAEEAKKESENKYRDLYDFLPIPVYEMDLEANIISANRAIYETFRGTEEDFKKGFKIWQILSPEEIDKSSKNIQRLLNGEKIGGTEYTLMRLDGSVFPAIVISSVVHSDGKPMGLRVAIIDITDSKKAEGKLLESEERYKALFDRSLNLIYTMDFDGQFIDANDVALNLFGYKREEISSVNIASLVDEDQLPLAFEIIQEIMETGTQKDLREFRVRHKDGTYIYVETQGSAVISKGKPVAIQAIAKDITERKQAEEIILQSEKRFKTLYQESPIPTLTWQKKGDDFFLVDFNRAAILLSEGKARNFIGTTAHELYRKRPEIINDMHLCFKKQSTISRELVSQDFAPGKSLSVYYSYIAPDLVITHAQDITEVKQAVEALQRSEENFRLSLDSSPLGVRISTIEAETIYANMAILDIYGYDSIEELNKTPVNERYTPQSYAGYKIRKEKRKRGELGPSEYEISIVRKNGEIRNLQVFRKEVIWNGTKQFQVIYKDITEHKRAEEKLNETLESLRQSIKTTIQVLGTAAEARDPYTAGHQKRVADLARAIATEMKLPHDKIEGIRMAGSIHDVGKLSIPAEILSRPTELTDIEFSLIKEHSRSGYEMLKDVESPWPLAQIVYQHHERMNGTGYPRNLKGDEIILEARIMAVADVVESMASHRPYRPTLGVEAALEEIEKNKGILYDDTVADTCLKLFREKGFNFQEA